MGVFTYQKDVIPFSSICSIEQSYFFPYRSEQKIGTNLYSFSLKIGESYEN